MLNPRAKALLKKQHQVEQIDAWLRDIEVQLLDCKAQHQAQIELIRAQHQRVKGMIRTLAATGELTAEQLQSIGIEESS